MKKSKITKNKADIITKLVKLWLQRPLLCYNLKTKQTFKKNTKNIYQTKTPISCFTCWASDIANVT